MCMMRSGGMSILEPASEAQLKVFFQYVAVATVELCKHLQYTRFHLVARREVSG